METDDSLAYKVKHVKQTFCKVCDSVVCGVVEHGAFEGSEAGHHCPNFCPPSLMMNWKTCVNPRK